MSAPGKSPPTTSPSGSASPPEGAPCLSSPFSPSFRPPGRRAAPSRDRRAEGLTKALPNAPTTAVALRSRIFGLQPRPGRRGERSVQPTSAEGANGSRLSGFACGRDDVLRGRHDLTSPPPSPRPSAARAGAYWLPERPRGHANISPASSHAQAPPFVIPGKAKPRSGTGEPRAYGTRSRRKPTNACASPVPDLAMLVREDAGKGLCNKPPPRVPMAPGSSAFGLRPEGRRSEKTPENRPYPPGRQRNAAASVTGARAEVGHERSSVSQVVLLSIMEQRASLGPSGPRRQTVSPIRYFTPK